MPKKLTFLDAGVLMAGARESSQLREVALQIINDPDREFITTNFVRLETELKCDYYGYQEQMKFYEIFFQYVDSYDGYEEIVAEAFRVGKRFGLNAMDALHIAAARLIGVEEFITTERPASPFRNVKGVKIVFLQP